MKRSKETNSTFTYIQFSREGDLARYSNEETDTKEVCNFNIDAMISDLVYNFSRFHKHYVTKQYCLIRLQTICY
jgi:hypothetical protein